MLSPPPDFLRHVATKVLSPTAIDIKRLDEARRLLGKAESKYKFSSFGGDPQRLAEYLLSPDFIDLALVLGADITKKLLDAITNTYTDSKIRAAVNKIREELTAIFSSTEEYNPNRPLLY